MIECIPEAKLLVCVGHGGTGKTSIAASLALEAAQQGKRTLVLTIDPARRLANALGLKETGHQEVFLSSDQFQQQGLPVPKGRLSMMMLETSYAWDRIVERYQPDPELRRRIRANRFYQTLANGIAGSQEYMAMEQVYELMTRSEDPLDLVVLDTPPLSNAVDFFDAPSRIMEVLDNNAARWILDKTTHTSDAGIVQKLFDVGASVVAGAIATLTGPRLLEELSDWIQCISEMLDGIKNRGDAVKELLRSPSTHFAIVVRPTYECVADVQRISLHLAKHGGRVSLLVINRSVLNPFEGTTIEHGDEEALAKVLPTPCLELALKISSDLQERHAAQKKQANFLMREYPHLQVKMIPEFAFELTDLAALHTLRGHLVG